MEFYQLKQIKERGITHDELFDKAKEYFKNADSVVIVGISSEGLIETYYTKSGNLNAIGMIEVAKSQLLQEMES